MADSFLLGIRWSDVALSIRAVHMIIFLFSQDAYITSAVCLDAYSASEIVGSKPTETSLAAWKVAKGLSYTPFLFAYTPCFQRTCPRSARHRFEFQHGALGISCRYGEALEPQALPLGERFGLPRYNRNALASHNHQDRRFPHLWITGYLGKKLAARRAA